MGKDEWETEILSNIQPRSQNKFAQYQLCAVFEDKLVILLNL